MKNHGGTRQRAGRWTQLQREQRALAPDERYRTMSLYITVEEYHRITSTLDPTLRKHVLLWALETPAIQRKIKAHLAKRSV